MDGNAHKNKSAAIFINQTHGDVRQDKSAFARGRDASPQPASADSTVRPQPPATHSPQPPHPKHTSRRTDPLTLWVDPLVKANLRETAAREGISISAAGNAYLKKGMQSAIDMQYGALLQPVIEQAIDRRLKARDARFAALLVRIAYDTGQSRSVLTNLLARSPGMSPDILDSILDQSGQRAKANLTHLSPQIAELIEIVETWMRDKTERRGD